jgi:hypothetical protein
MLRGKKKLDAYVKLFELFERELKKHHFFFNVGGYEIRYIITTKVFDEKYNIEVTLYTKRYRKHSTFLKETKTYYQRLKGFAYLFGFKNVQMLRSLERIKIFNDPEYRSIPVRERIALNYIDNFRAEEFTAMADLIGE